MESAAASDDTPCSTTPLLIAAGPGGGQYPVLGDAVALAVDLHQRERAARGEELRCPIQLEVTTEGMLGSKLAGSMDNLSALARGQASFAIAQADAAFFAATGFRTLSGDGHGAPQLAFEERQRITGLMALQDEVLHVLLRRPLGLRSLRDLAGLHVHLGASGSGTRLTAELVLESMGLTECSVCPDCEGCGDSSLATPALDPCQSTGRATASCRLVNGNYDAVFLVARPCYEAADIALMDRTHFNLADPLEGAPRVPCTPPAHTSAWGRLSDSSRPGSAQSSAGVVGPIASLYSFPPETATDIHDRFPTLLPTMVRRADYPSLPNDISTVGVRTLLLTQRDLPPGQAAEVLDAVLGEHSQASACFHALAQPGMEAPSEACRALEFDQHTSAVLAKNSWTEIANAFDHIQPYRWREGVAFGLHSEAEAFSAHWFRFSSRRLAYEFMSHAPLITLTAVLSAWVLMAMVTTRFFYAAFLRHWHRGRNQVVMIIVIAAFLSASLITWAAEYRVNACFHDPFNASWSIAEWLLSGFEDRAPVTGLGQIGSVLVMGSWAFLLLVVVNYYIGDHVRRLMVEGDDIPGRCRDHVVICHWNDRAHGITRQLLASRRGQPSPLSHVIIVHPHRLDRHKLRQSGDTFLRDAIFVHGDPADLRTLARVRVEHAHAVVILADDEAGSAADGKTLLTLQSLNEHMARCDDRPRLHVVAEFVDGACIEQYEGVLSTLRGANSGRRGAPASVSGRGATGGALKLEVLDVERTQSRPFAQGATTAGLVELFFDLATSTQGDTQVMTIAAPTELFGLPFGEASRAFTGLCRRTGARASLVGVRRRGATKFDVNPEPTSTPTASGGSSARRLLGDDDELLILVARADAHRFQEGPLARLWESFRRQPWTRWTKRNRPT